MTDSIIDRILTLKKRRNAVILVHNYQPDEVQDIADFLGDSLDLSQKAATTNADVIVFCGVHFMAETASILSPEKIVLLPEIASGCPMADMLNAEKLGELKKLNPDAVTVAYINTTAEVKAETDICCTSANAVKIVNAVQSDKIIFVPDRNLGNYVAQNTKKQIILSDGYCPIHMKITKQNILEAKKLYPNAEVIVHPECTSEVISAADKVLSTSGMCRYAKESNHKSFIIGTEVGILHRLKKENPDKSFYPASENALCVNMKKNSLEKVLWALEDMKYQIKVEENIRIKAKFAIDKMLEFSRID